QEPRLDPAEARANVEEQLREPLGPARAGGFPPDPRAADRDHAKPVLRVDDGVALVQGHRPPVCRRQGWRGRHRNEAPALPARVEPRRGDAPLTEADADVAAHVARELRAAGRAEQPPGRQAVKLEPEAAAQASRTYCRRHVPLT